MSRLLRLILLDSCCFLPKNWKLVETRSSQLSFNLALGHVCWIPVNCWANTHEPRPYIPWLSWPADLHSLFWPLPSLTRASLRPLALLITTYYDKSELRCSDWNEIQRCPLPLAARLVTSWPRVRCLLRHAFGSPEASPGLSRWRHEQWPEDPSRLYFSI